MSPSLTILSQALMHGALRCPMEEEGYIPMFQNNTLINDPNDIGLSHIKGYVGCPDSRLTTILEGNFHVSLTGTLWTVLMADTWADIQERVHALCRGLSIKGGSSRNLLGYWGSSGIKSEVNKYMQRRVSRIIKIIPLKSLLSISFTHFPNGCACPTSCTDF